VSKTGFGLRLAVPMSLFFDKGGLVFERQLHLSVAAHAAGETRALASKERINDTKKNFNGELQPVECSALVRSGIRPKEIFDYFQAGYPMFTGNKK
jgi:hypothetical protein